MADQSKVCAAQYDVRYCCYRVPEEEREALLATASGDLRDIEQTLLKHIAMELRDEDPYQFVNAYTAGIVQYSFFSFYKYT